MEPLLFDRVWLLRNDFAPLSYPKRLGRSQRGAKSRETIYGSSHPAFGEAGSRGSEGKRTAL